MIIVLIVKNLVLMKLTGEGPYRNLDYRDMIISICKVLHFNELELIFYQQIVDKLSWKATKVNLEYSG